LSTIFNAKIVLEAKTARALADAGQGPRSLFALPGALRYNLDGLNVPGTFFSWEAEMSNWLERYRGYILITVINVVVLGGVTFFFLRPPQPELTVTVPTPTATPLPTPTPRPLQVYVSGAVNSPDVYELPAESIVKDAIEAAGGATSEADLDRINLALSMADGQHIYVPQQGEESPPVSPPNEPSGTTSGQAGGKININTASQSEIEILPGIGPSKAQGIIENRPYDNIEEIQKVPGIGEGTFKKIEDLITVD
jgi:competence protein ComEA